MPSYYLDSSALLKIYLEEPGADRIRRLVDNSDQDDLMISELTLLECRSAIRRRERTRDISTVEAGRFIVQLGYDRRACVSFVGVA